MAPMTMSSILGWLAAVVEMVSPSQPRPSGLHRMWISLTAGVCWVFRP
jgi:hypothetical protein